LTDRTQNIIIRTPKLPPPEPAAQGYDRRNLTYSNTFSSPSKRLLIRAMEWMTGKITIMRMLRTFRNQGPHARERFWLDALDVMRIEIRTPLSQVQNIPAKGPVIIVANHPHGMVDGMVIAALISKVRHDYKILVRSILTGIDDMAASFLISVPFPHEEDAQQKGIAMRAAAMETLAANGVIALFPSGVVASSETMTGPAIEAEWNVFTAKMIRRSGATVVPLYFRGRTRGCIRWPTGSRPPCGRACCCTRSWPPANTRRPRSSARRFRPRRSASGWPIRVPGWHGCVSTRWIWENSQRVGTGSAPR
jgi:putative hemolysin